MKFPRFVRRAPLVLWTVAEPRRSRENLAFALSASFYLHMVLLSLSFGIPGLGLPAMAFPWSERRVPAESIAVRLVPAPRPAPPAPASAPVRLRLSQDLSSPPAARQPKPPTRTAKAFEVVPKAAEAAPPPSKRSAPKRVARTEAPAAPARARERKVTAKPRPQILAQSNPQEETFKVPPPKRAEPEKQRAPESAAKKEAEESPDEQAEQAARKQVEDAARLEAEEAARRRAEEEARQRKLALQKELEAKKEEARRLEIARKEEEARKQVALELEARKLAEEVERKETAELARKQAAALEAKKLEDAKKIEEARKQDEEKKQEELKRLAMEAEALKRAEEAARKQAEARKKEQEARRLAEEAATRAKEAAARQRADAEAGAQRERERLAAQPPPQPGALTGKELAAKALEQLRESRVAPVLPPASKETPRRRSLIGVERDVPLRMYVESWRWKIERNGPLNYRPSAGMRARENPIVTVSIRSDGSLEDVVIHRSSGVRELDMAVIRIARLLAPYSAFPPDLARQYDVIDIRRVWSFEDALKIMDEM